MGIWGWATGGNKGKWFRAEKRKEGLEYRNMVNGGKGISFLQIHDRLFN